MTTHDAFDDPDGLGADPVDQALQLGEVPIGDGDVDHVELLLVADAAEQRAGGQVVAACDR